MSKIFHPQWVSISMNILYWIVIIDAKICNIVADSEGGADFNCIYQPVIHHNSLAHLFWNKSIRI